MKLTLAIVVVLIALLGVTAFFFLPSDDDTDGATITPTTQTIVDDSEVVIDPVTTETTSESSAADTVEINMDSGSFFFAPNQIEVTTGDTVVVNITSEGNHNFAIDEFDIDVDTPNATTTTITFVADKAGTYEFYCNIGSHRERGQKGTLVVN